MNIQARIRKVLQHHKLTVHGDCVVEADLMAVLEEASAVQAQQPDSTEGLRKMLDAANKSDSSRWEIGFRNIVAILYGPQHEFKIADVVERVRQQAQEVPKPCGTLTVSSTTSTTTVDVEWSDPQPHTLPNGKYPLFIGERNADH